MDLILQELDIILLSECSIALILAHLVHTTDDVLVRILHCLRQVVLFWFVYNFDCGHIGFVIVIVRKFDIIR